MPQSNTPKQPKLRVAIFGSYYRGDAVLESLLSDKDLMKRIEIVVVATDSTKHNTLEPGKRFWRYRATDAEKNMVFARALKAKGVEVLTGNEDGNVLTSDFREEVRQSKPDIIYVASFGPRLSKDIIELPRLGCFNLHPTDGLPNDKGEPWPSCVGPDPFEQMFGKEPPSQYARIALHEVNTEYDDGPLTFLTPEKSAVKIPYEKFRQDVLPQKKEKFFLQAKILLTKHRGAHTAEEVKDKFLTPAVFISESVLSRLAEGRPLSDKEIEECAHEEMEARIMGEAVKIMHRKTAHLAGMAVNVHLRRQLGMGLTQEQIEAGYSNERGQGAPTSQIEAKPAELPIVEISRPPVRGINPNPANERGKPDERGQGGGLAR